MQAQDFHKRLELVKILDFINENKISLSKQSCFNLINRFSKSYPIKFLCKSFHVSRSGYYQWLQRIKNPDPDEKYVIEINKFQLISDCIIGYKKMTTYLKSLGFIINHKKVYRIIKKYGLLSRVIRSSKKKIFNISKHISKNRINKVFEASEPNRKWCIDITCIDTTEESYNLCAIIDLYDRFLVASNIHSKATQALVNSTVEKALESVESNKDATIIIHTDQGTQFTSAAYNKFSKKINFNISMSKKAVPTDNCSH